MPQLADTQIGYYIRLTRIQEWWEKLLHLAGSAFLLWTYTNQTKIDAIDFSVYVTAVFCLLLGGYTINDAADFYQDKAVGRIGMPERQHSLSLSLVSLTVGLGLIFSITSEILPRVITIVTILIGVQYSLPPLLFKERRIWGVIVGAVTQKPAIFLIFIAIIGAWNWLSVVLTIWLFCSGMLG
ncbi:MAG: UbiA family prenyltransferase, partial [Deltaproteobacteria bacterium]|nr:UbiA family prenyltransferase [Deltaproteobacteria bacterium]